MNQFLHDIAQFFDSANIPTRDRIYFDGESVIDLNVERQAKEKKVIEKLAKMAIAKPRKRAKRRIRGAKRKRKHDLMLFEAQRLWVDGFPPFGFEGDLFDHYIDVPII